MTLVKVNNPLTKNFDGLMKEFFNDFPAAMNRTFREDVLHFPPVNIAENDQAYLLELSAPGFDKADFKISLEKDILTVSTEKKESNTETTDKAIRKEFSYRSFKRSFTLDEKINAENIHAKYENGILKLELPKKEIQKPETREISIQ